MAVREDIAAWAQRMDWLHTNAVVCLGYTEARPWEELRKYRSDLTVYVFDPDNARVSRAGKVPDKVHVVSHLSDLRNAIGGTAKAKWKIELMGDPSLQPQWNKPMAAAVDEACRYVTSIEVTARGNVVPWTHAALEFLPRLAGRPTFDRLDASFAGRPGILVGAGPSLSRGMKDLARLQGYAPICAVTSAIGALAAADVQPDICCTVEGRGSPLDKTLKLPQWRNAVLCHGSHVHPVVYDVPARAIIPTLQSVGPIGEWLCAHMGITPIQTGGSVATLAYSILRALGCDPIIMIGVDCSFGDAEGKEVYADGVIRADDEVFNHKVDERVMAWGGVGNVGTTYALSSYRQWFEAQARSGGGFVNCSEGGAHVAGWADVPMSKVADRILAEHVSRRDFAGEIVDAAKKAEPLDGAKMAAGLREQIDGSVGVLAAAKRVHDAITETCDALQDYVNAGPTSQVFNSLGVAPLQEAIHFPEPNQLHALGRSFEIIKERADEARPLMERAIQLLEESNA